MLVFFTFLVYLEVAELKMLVLLDNETNETSRSECLEKIGNRDLSEIPGGVGIVSKLAKPIKHAV